MIFVKFKKQNVVCAVEFSWYAKKVVCTTTYNVLEILIFHEKICFSRFETAYFYALFHKKIYLKMNKLPNLGNEMSFCAREFL